MTGCISVPWFVAHACITCVWLACVWHHDAMAHSEEKPMPSPLGSRPCESAITALQKCLVTHVFVIAGCVLRCNVHACVCIFSDKIYTCMNH